MESRRLQLRVKRGGCLRGQRANLAYQSVEGDAERADALVTRCFFPQRLAGVRNHNCHLAPWLLTSLLRETLIRSAPSRVVTVASEASRQADGFDPIAALIDKRTFSARGSSAIYGQTKLMNIMFSMELARRLEDTGVTSNCLCPGFNVTGLGRELWFAAPLERLLTWLKVGNPERGAGIIVRLASDRTFANVTGGYFSVTDAKALVPVAPGNDPKAQQALWQATAERVAAALTPGESRYGSRTSGNRDHC